MSINFHSLTMNVKHGSNNLKLLSTFWLKNEMECLKLSCQEKSSENYLSN